MGKYKPKNSSKVNGTKRRKKDLDEVYADIQPAGLAKIKSKPLDIDLPGMGQYYCAPCGRYLMSPAALATHNSSKPHKRRVATLGKEVPYGVDIEEVYGMKVDNGLKKDKTGTPAL